MRILMVSIGSTGDVRPYILLARELKAKGHDICICAFENFKDMVEAEGFKFEPIKWDALSFMKQIMQSNKGGVEYLKNLNKQLKDMAEPMVLAIDRSAQKSDLMISTFFGSISQRIAEKHNIKFVQTHYYPMDINDIAPISSVKGFKAGKLWYHFSYKMGYLVLNSLESIYIQKNRNVYKLKQKKIVTKPMYRINGKKFPVIYAISSVVFPSQEYWENNISVVGYFFDKQEQYYKASKELENFLNSGEPPVYIGFGSMVSDKLQKYMKITLGALEITGQRAVIVQGWGDLPQIDNKNVFISEAIPHDYIFQKVSVVVHHGGAGTFAAGLRHKRPTLVLPFGGDQSFSARRAYDLGIGPRPLNPDWITAERFAKKLLDLENNPKYKANMEYVAGIVNAENGVETAANIIEEYINKR